jgi:hypothetical protein
LVILVRPASRQLQLKTHKSIGIPDGNTQGRGLKQGQ